MHGLNFVSIPTGTMECRSAVVDACLLQCQGELTVVVMNPLKVFTLPGAPLRGTHSLLMLDHGLFVLPGVRRKCRKSGRSHRQKGG